MVEVVGSSFAFPASFFLQMTGSHRPGQGRHVLGCIMDMRGMEVLFLLAPRLECVHPKESITI